MKKALVLFSGGQDSTTCLAWALAHFDHVETIGFDYGQRHAVELACRSVVLKKIPQLFPAWADTLKDDHCLTLPALQAISETALTRDAEITFNDQGLPNTFVPGRNVLFLTYAAALAYRRGMSDLVGGMCETDFSGYPDCRKETLKALEQAITLGMAHDFVFHTPLMHLDKAATWQMAATLGGTRLTDLIVNDTHSCYKGVRDARYPWGYGCNACPACDLRRKGFEEYAIKITS